MSPDASANTTPTSLQYHAATRQGRHPTNDDDYLATRLHNGTYLFAIADGLGGLPNAHAASHQAITTLKSSLNTQEDLAGAVNDANIALFNLNKRRPQPMATTLVACLLDPHDDVITIAHLGDSRAYTINHDTWHTTDHTEVQDLVDCGVLTPEQAHVHPLRNRLTQALGLAETPLISLMTRPMPTSLLLCSDGLSAYVPDSDIVHIVSSNPPDYACELLIERALDLGSLDDITVICVST